ncbi:MAG: NUDIX hydrolase [Bacteroidia bacterium]|nr:NUDIX hydrolase [Bacteroidia bacterium]
MQSLQDSKKFKQWKATLDANGVDLREVEELHTVRKRNGEVLFSLISIDAYDKNGQKFLPVVFLKGHFISVVTCLIDQDTQEEFLLLVTQPRVGDGSLFYEHPAGMMDSASDPYEMAIKEMEEETGLVITRDQLTLMNQEPILVSPGAMDEGGWFFFCEVEMSGEEIRSYHDRATGAAGENEFIRTYVATIPESFKLIRNSNGLMANYMFVEMRAQG